MHTTTAASRSLFAGAEREPLSALVCHPLEHGARLTRTLGCRCMIGQAERSLAKPHTAQLGIVSKTKSPPAKTRRRPTLRGRARPAHRPEPHKLRRTELIPRAIFEKKKAGAGIRRQHPPVEVVRRWCGVTDGLAQERMAAATIPTGSDSP